MKFIQKQEREPVEFTKWKRQEEEVLDSYYKREVGAAKLAFEHLASSPPPQADPGIHYYSKQQLKDSLLDEQGFLCAYCMRGLINDSSCTIDYLKPKSSNPRENTFHYHNLLSSCSGSVSKRGRLGNHGVGYHLKEDLRHCNNKKGEKSIPISPLNSLCESRFIFSISGEILPAFGDDWEAIQTIELLGLNSSLLVRQRASAIERMLYPDLPDNEGNLTNRLISREEGLKKVSQLRKKGMNNRYEPFCIALIYVIEQLIGSND